MVARSPAGKNGSPLGRSALSRRMLLGGLGAGLVAGTGQAFGTDFPAPPSGLGGRPMPGALRPLANGKRKFGYAIVGLGQYAINQILPAFAECQYARVTALVSGDPAKAQRIGAQYGIGREHLYSYDDFDKIAHDPEVDAVYILLPNALHCAMTVRAFKAGKHVLCEKPMATSVGDCQEMIHASQQAHKYLMIGYRCHFDPLTQKAVAMLNGGAVGNRQIVTTDNSDINDPRHDVSQTWRFTRALSGGGSLMDLGIYGVNGSRYLLGEDPVQVQAIIVPNKDPLFASIEDTIVWTFLYKSGAVAHGSSSFTVNAASAFRVQGDKANLVMDPATSYWSNSVSLRTSGDTHTWSTPMFTIPALNQCSAQLDYLASCVAQGQPPVRASAAEGLQDIRLIMAMYESAHTGQPVDTSQWANWRKAV